MFPKTSSNKTRSVGKPTNHSTARWVGRDRSWTCLVGRREREKLVFFQGKEFSFILAHLVVLLLTVTLTDAQNSLVHCALPYFGNVDKCWCFSGLDKFEGRLTISKRRLWKVSKILLQRYFAIGMDDVDKDIDTSEQKLARWIKEEKRIECYLLSSCIQREWSAIIASYIAVCITQIADAGAQFKKNPSWIGRGLWQGVCASWHGLNRAHLPG